MMPGSRRGASTMRTQYDPGLAAASLRATWTFGSRGVKPLILLQFNRALIGWDG